MSDIQFVTEPSVYVTGRLLPDGPEIRRFVDDHGFTGAAILPAGTPPQEVPITVGSRTCYQSFDHGRPHAEHVRHLVEVMHGSCLEHCVWQVLLSGISRACGRELLRHRHLSPSELSQRYCDLTKTRFVVPPKLLPDLDWPLKGDQAAGARVFAFRRAIQEAMQAYRTLLPEKSTKRDREAARSVLPECVETRVVFTANARAFRNLFERRCSEHADAEIRRVCCLLFGRLAADAPNVFADYTATPLPDGTFALMTPTRSV